MKFTKKQFKKLRLVSLTAVITLVAASATAGIKDEMDNVFGGMGSNSNMTLPGIHKTQSRGLVSGGRYTVRTKIVDETLISAQLPSAKGGCGGIDIYGGSFSFINADQLVSLLRAVAANAKGYAFQLALDALCKNCMKIMDGLQKKIQQLNDQLGNSCQMAKGIIDGGVKAANALVNTEASLSEVTENMTDDFFAAYNDSESAQQKTVDRDPAGGKDMLAKKELAGNVVWHRLQNQNVQSWFRYGDRETLEMLMSITGSYIKKFPEPGVSAGGNSQELGEDEFLLPHKTGIVTAMVLGQKQVPVYKCDEEDYCAAPTTVKVDIDGMVERIEKVLLGSGAGTGVVYKYATNTGIISPTESQLIASLPSSYGTLVRNLAINSESLARTFITQTSSLIAIPMIEDVINQMVQAVNLALFQSQSAHVATVRKAIADARKSYSNELDLLRERFGNLSDVISQYNEIVKNTRKARYTTATLIQPTSSKD